MKSENVMVDCDTLKTTLIDFGLSEVVCGDDISEKDSGSYEYLPPEKVMPNRDAYSGFKADVWSLGVILFAMIYGQFPWSKSERKEYIKTKKQHPTFELPKNGPWHTDEVKDLLKQIFTLDFNDRISLQQVMEHPWLQTKPCPYPKLLRLGEN